VALSDGDVIHFGTAEFRIGVKEAEPPTEETTTSNLSLGSLSRHFQASEELFRALLDHRAVVPLFQPIVHLPDGRRHGYEVLGRGAFVGLPTHPMELFAVADALGLGARLSQTFWEEGLACGMQMAGNPAFFINIHHSELEGDDLARGLRRFRETYETARVTVEISEKAVTDLTRMARLRRDLTSLNMRLAYDDFGAGQSRFLELAEVPPHILKFDIGLVRGIHQRAKRFHQMVQTLVRMASELGIVALAEGVECREEREVCAQLGFRLAQGYFFGRPGRPAVA
jgi:EAL domain-containing protein (putative c-di-GMP-specific phosphodiesterase class I)